MMFSGSAFLSANVESNERSGSAAKDLCMSWHLCSLRAWQTPHESQLTAYLVVLPQNHGSTQKTPRKSN